MSGNGFFSRSNLAKAAIASAILLGIGGLGIYAVIQGIMEQHFIHFAQAFVPLLIAAFGLRVLVGYWMAFFKHGNESSNESQ